VDGVRLRGWARRGGMEGKGKGGGGTEGRQQSWGALRTGGWGLGSLLVGTRGGEGRRGRVRVLPARLGWAGRTGWKGMEGLVGCLGCWFGELG